MFFVGLGLLYFDLTCIKNNTKSSKKPIKYKKNCLVVNFLSYN